MAKIVLEPGEQEILFGTKLFLSATRKMGVSDKNAANILSGVLKEQRENPNYDWCKSKKYMKEINYTCKDCAFFKHSTCKSTDEYRYTSASNSSCKNFEYKDINVKL